MSEDEKRQAETAISGFFNAAGDLLDADGKSWKLVLKLGDLPAFVKIGGGWELKDILGDIVMEAVDADMDAPARYLAHETGMKVVWRVFVADSGSWSTVKGEIK